MYIDSITKKFGTLIALDSVSAKFEFGRLYVLTGPNGAGKTTLLRIIAGLLKPTSGKIVFTNELGVMMQESYLYRDLTARENLELYANLYSTQKKCVDEIAELFDLKSFIDHEIGALSHGQKQRVSFARAILPKPKVLLLDEPFLGLDATSTARVQNFLAGFKRDGGLALIATHELDLIKGIADALIILEHGRLK